MKDSHAPTSKFANYLVTAVLVLVPFHAFLTVWGSSLVGHYTGLRLWDDVLLAVLAGVAAWWLLRDGALRRNMARSPLVQIIAAYAVLSVLLGVISLTKGDVTPKALAYGLLVNLRFLAWFLVVLLAARRTPFLRAYWLRLLLVPAALVVVFAALQYTVLPHDFLSHFGYDTHTTIAPIETINHNTHYIRVQSTLRGANPLGAYLVIVIAALAACFMRGRRRLLCAGFGLLTLFALYASGSRSAWIGSLLTLICIGWVALPSRRSRVVAGMAGVAVLIILSGLYLLLRNDVGVQNALLHTQQHSRIAVSSNAAHDSALRKGIREVLHQPFGDGPGTAGPASVYNGSHGTRIAENYFLQIAQETGWLGLALLLAIFWLVTCQLYEQRWSSLLAFTLLASFLGLLVVALLSHNWTDDTLAFIWWGFAGIALAEPPRQTVA